MGSCIGRRGPGTDAHRSGASQGSARQPGRGKTSAQRERAADRIGRTRRFVFHSPDRHAHFHHRRRPQTVRSTRASSPSGPPCRSVTTSWPLMNRYARDSSSQDSERVSTTGGQVQSPEQGGAAMTCNVGNVERMIRVVLGIALIGIGYFAELPRWGALATYVVGAVAL